MKKKITILGSTGSIGTQTLDIIRKYSHIFEVDGLACGNNIKLLEKQIKEFKPKVVSSNLKIASDVTNVVNNACEVVSNTNSDIYILAMVGLSGLKPAYLAVKKGAIIALANKETLVSAGDIIIKDAEKYGSKIYPVDSEHSAIWQCLNCNRHKKFKNIILTASGGAFRDKTKDELINIKAKDALLHPVWDMGQKVTIDSATLMNKGLELIEAMHLFNASPKNIKTIIHRQSIIHSMVEYNDNSIIAQLSAPDMKLAIQLAMTYPERYECDIESLDFHKLSQLTFENPDLERFPCLKIAYNCANKNMESCAIMNSTNEECVKLFLKDKISFYQISDIINNSLDKFSSIKLNNIDDILELDNEIKDYVDKLMRLK